MISDIGNGPYDSNIYTIVMSRRETLFQILTSYSFTLSIFSIESVPNLTLYNIRNISEFVKDYL
jgi:hypothetical protein